MKNPKLKLKDFYNSLNKPLKEQEEKPSHIPNAAAQVAGRKKDTKSTSNREENVKIEIPGTEGETDVKIKFGEATGPLEDITISFNHEGDEVEQYAGLDFEYNEDEGSVEIEDHGEEGKDLVFVAVHDDATFFVDVSVESDYDQSGNIQEVDWDTLKVEFDQETESLKETSERKRQKEGTCGYGKDGDLGEEPAGSHLLELDKPDCPERFWCSKDADCDDFDDASCGQHECHGGCCTAMCSPDPGAKGDYGSSTKRKKSKLGEALVKRLKIRAGIIK